MQTLQDLIEEAKLRTVWWAVCIFAVTYFLTHTSKSMWMNIPIAILLVSGVHIILTEVDFHWKIRKSNRRSYLSHLEKKQLSVNDSRLNTLPPPPKWKRKIDSPVVESAMDDFTNKILQEFVLDLWYSDITPDKEAPQLIHAIIMDIFAEISLRVKDINLVDMLTRDVVDLVGDHLELFRKNQAKIGREVMGTLSSEERDERIKHHLMKSKELHPALISPESEYKFLKRIMGALLAAVLRPREAQCPLVRCITRELLTCLIMEPVMRLMSPGRINELIEGIFLATSKGEQDGFDDQFNNTQNQTSNTNTNNEKGFQDSTSINNVPSSNQKSEKTTPTPNNQKETIPNPNPNPNPNSNPNPNPNPNPSANVASGPMSDWARAIEAATQRRTEVLQPENLENMWTRGRNYMKKSQKKSVPPKLKSGVNENSNFDINDYQQRDSNADEFLSFDYGSDGKSRKSTSASESNLTSLTENVASPKVGGTIIQEFYSVNTPRNSDVQNDNIGFDNKGIRTEGYVPKLRCRVLGAFFEKSDSKSFAVYSIAVTDADNKTWFVKRRYRNFEKLHRHLKDIPNYTLHLPPKRIFSSSTEDAFVHQRCIQLDKYLKELLSTANLAEQHEVWDFLSLSSKSYSFGRSSSVAKPLAVNVDDAVDDIVRQFKGGLIKKVPSESSSSSLNRNTTWDLNEQNDNNTPLKHGTPLKQPTLDMRNFFSDYEDGEKDKRVNNEEMESVGILYGGNLDNEVKLRGLSPKIGTPKIGKSDELNNNNNKNLGLEKKNSSEVRSEVLSLAAGSKEDPLGVPAEWAPPNVSVPLLNLVDKMFQLNRRGWLRRQVFWMSKQILQLMMEDAIDDWLLRQIQLLRRDELVAQGIRWIQDILWPEGIFFTKVKPSQPDSSQENDGSAPTQKSGSKAIKPGSFEEQLEATRRASDIKKMMLKGAPTTLVSLIGRKQYKRCAKDMYYFLQSAVCLKQLTYGLLELVLITVFPELQEIISNIHKQKGQEL